ncbi:NPHP3 [Symbiodinium sp. CCMP2456]|nr:NPHP3 [Symbiodinium sp. CCMP2456]
MQHQYVWSPDIVRQLENKAYRPRAPDEQYSSLPLENARLMKSGGFGFHDGGRQALPRLPTEEVCLCTPKAWQRFPETKLAVANVDTVTASLALNNACALNFANAVHPGGGYLHGARAQEEDLCRLLPQLHPALVDAQEQGLYPLKPDAVLLTRDLLAVREPGSYNLRGSLGTCSVITAAMPNGSLPESKDAPCREHKHAPPLSRQEFVLFFMRRTVVDCQSSITVSMPVEVTVVFSQLMCVLPAKSAVRACQSCPRLFAQQLASPDFRGAFDTVVFAIIDPRGDGNLRPFREVLQTLGERSEINMCTASIRDGAG